MNKELKIEFLKQACKDIEENAEDIIGSTKYDKSLSVEIRFCDEDIPSIIINKEFPVSYTNNIDACIVKNGWN